MNLELIKSMTDTVYPKGCILVAYAGDGSQADYIPVVQSYVTCIEARGFQVEALRAKGYQTIWEDFLLYKPWRTLWDTIYLFPPAIPGVDLRSVQHAFKMLRFGGGLVSPMMAEVFTSKSAIYSRFRTWIREQTQYAEIKVDECQIVPLLSMQKKTP